MHAIFNKSIAKGEVVVPPSKSYAHRYLIASFLSGKKSIIRNISLSEDIKATLSCLKELGASYIYENASIVLEINKEEIINKYKLTFNCFESGSTLRFMIPIALLTGKDLIFYGSEKLLSRGLTPYFKIFDKLNIQYELNEKYLKIKGKLTAFDFEIEDNISSQFVSGLLFALPLLNGDSSIKIPSNMQSINYIEMTLNVLKNAGINIDFIDNVFHIKGNQKYLTNGFVNEGDYSNASFLDAFNYLNGDVKLLGLNSPSLQGDKVYKNYFDKLSLGYEKIDIGDSIDLGPILFVFASLFYGGHFINTKRLRIKESDRIEDLRIELEKINVKFEVLENEVIIDNSKVDFKQVEFSSHNDHRIAMALSVLLSKCSGKLFGIECVNKSYPTFFEDLIKLGIEVKLCD